MYQYVVMSVLFHSETGILVMLLSLSHQYVTPIQGARTSTLHPLLKKGIRKISLPALRSVKAKECGPKCEGNLIQACRSPLLCNQSLQGIYFVLS